METFFGKSISRGVVIGPILFLGTQKRQTVHCEITDAQAEIARYEAAREEAIRQLNSLYEKARLEAGDNSAQIFDIHAMLLEDSDYCDCVYEIIRKDHCDAASAVIRTGEQMSGVFAAMENYYFKARAADFIDISARVANILNGVEQADTLGDRTGIVAVEDLTPSQTIQMDKDHLMGFVTRWGSTSSHTAILARTMGIPALVGIMPNPAWEGKTAILDGESGCLILEPDEATLTAYDRKAEAYREKQKLLQTLKGKENVSQSGKKIEIFANVGSLADIALAQQNDAGGIGLFRTEFIYMNEPALPTEEQQLQIYKKALLAMPGKKVVFRTMDIGADKQVPYLDLGNEANPALGCRAVRLYQKRPDILKTQLRALYRASVFGCMAIMFPMITSEEEIDAVRTVAAQVKKELMQEGKTFREDVKEGIMIETPAAAVISDRLASKVDFFSIGTNDLTQYTLAVDRQNAGLDEFYKPHHEAILRMIRWTVENARKAGIRVGICGELGADTALTAQFLAMGVDELSVSPSSVLEIRHAVRTSE